MSLRCLDGALAARTCACLFVQRARLITMAVSDGGNMSLLAVHEHPDGSYTVKDARGQIVHVDLPGIIDFNAHGSIPAEDADDPVDLTGYAIDDWPQEKPFYHVAKKRKRKLARTGATQRSRAGRPPQHG
jgi:hypothetical protein